MWRADTNTTPEDWRRYLLVGEESKSETDRRCQQRYGAIGATEDEVHDISRSVTDVATEHLGGFAKNFHQKKSAFTMEVGGWVQV